MSKRINTTGEFYFGVFEEKSVGVYISIMSSSFMETVDGRTPKRSVINALRVYRDVTQMMEGKDIEVPSGTNVEQLTR